MKKILVGIDFSKGSINALNLAIVLAKKLPAEIMMVWVDKPMNPESLYAAVPGINRNEVTGRFEQIIKEYSDKIDKGLLNYRICLGKVYETIADQASQWKADYVVVGTHGISGYEELWIGSNANRIVAAAPCPVFTVRQTYKVKDSIEKIVLPIDHTSETVEKADYAAQIASAFQSQVLILGLYSADLSTFRKRVDNHVQKVAEKLKKHSINVQEFYEKAQNITATTLKFTEKAGADLICIMTEQETSSSNILLGQYAQLMVNHSQVPVLSVHPKEFYR